ncbi:MULTISPECIES: hypothetical protein [Haloarcula]|uniref:Uncharacterized protein n=1 Tax=Haloarcula pellucida TaxID=1427151 RepID=A0A830GGA1_9EURY|nr:MULTISPECIES: hypothetical protein [Halomicroarcula]MBX0346793.1 hypothetical protein [Halomicroarcula pellucida]MDS0277329.1 hypothetical protein [Halomicroarcula sp. S1AR25-4]GGN85533.1 hypothetical protein GCM10009030_02110 [Halomicroarcula pellucida]
MALIPTLYSIVANNLLTAKIALGLQIGGFLTLMAFVLTYFGGAGGIILGPAVGGLGGMSMLLGGNIEATVDEEYKKHVLNN